MNSNKKGSLSIWLILLMLFGAIASPVQASLWGEIKDQGRQLTRSLTPSAPIFDVATPLTAAEVADYPANYHVQRVIVPSHQTPLFVLQTGHEHRDTVVLVHGLGDLASKDWLTVIPALAQRYHVVAIDLPGFGLSQGAVFTYSPKEYAKVLDWVITTYRRPAEKVFLVGHSMGAAISLYYASQYPNQIDQLVLVDAAGILDRTAFIKQISKKDMDNADLPQDLRRILARVDNFTSKMLEKTGTGIDPTRLLNNNENFRNMTIGDQANVNAALALMEQNFSILNYQQIPATQIMWGEVDAVAPLRTAQALQHVLPFSKLHVIEGAGHVPMKSHQVIFNDILLNSLQMVEVDKHAKPPNDSQRVGTCDQDDNVYFSGQYQKITINDCKLVRFDQVDVGQLTVIDSIVTVASSRMGSLAQNMDITRSALTVTGSDVVGRINGERSRFDFAGVTLTGTSPVFVSHSTSRLVLSLVRIVTPTQVTRLGGSYVLVNQSLESAL